MRTLICGSMAYDTIMVFHDRFKNHILPDQLHILDSDVHIHKTYGNAFNKTPLTDELRQFGVDTVIITGFCAEYCVLSTCRGAEDQDLTPILLRGSLASSVPSRSIASRS